ncbi:hypothetical protein GALMADRAFT_1147761 [Galerina marginata CBS 339.88]|uniref:PLAC8-domain-containing protein n=1 Tax=Galerina marginata (strain CBS 339.88) TaxID=685588 RepID=A0A067S728_GALM3|nr:hypothetical protein GALMADRAFT_1147761 [Galerina marginata CBS 339.88]
MGVGGLCYGILGRTWARGRKGEGVGKGEGAENGKGREGGRYMRGRLGVRLSGGYVLRGSRGSLAVLCSLFFVSPCDPTQTDLNAFFLAPTPMPTRTRQRRYPTMLSYVNEGEERTSYVPPAQGQIQNQNEHQHRRRELLDGGGGVSRVTPTRPRTQAQLYAQAHAQAGAGGRTGSTAHPPHMQAHASRAQPQAQAPPRSHPHPRFTGAGAGAGVSVVAQQPRLHPGMPTPSTSRAQTKRTGTEIKTGIKTGNRNALGIPFSTDGKRDWSTDLCLYCEHDVGVWCSALWCPCIVYGKNKARLERLASPLPSPSPRRENSKTHPNPDSDTGPSACSDDCAVHACLTVFCLFGWAIQVPSRAHIRRRYSIHGSWIEDCAAALCCAPCALAQESKEIELEERSLGLGLGVGAEREREGERERWARVQYSGIYARW